MQWFLVMLGVLGVAMVVAKYRARRRIPPPPSFLKELASPDDEIRERASDALCEFSGGWSVEHLPAVYEAIRQSYPDDLEGICSTRVQLLNVLWFTRDADTVDFIANVFSSLPRDRTISSKALYILSEANSRNSVSTLLDLLEEHEPPLESAFSVFGRLLARPVKRELVEVLFPRIFKLLSQNDVKSDVYAMTIHCLKKGQIDVNELGRIKESLTRDFEQALKNLGRHEIQSFEVGLIAELLKKLIELAGFLPSETKLYKLLRAVLEVPSTRTWLDVERTDLRLQALITLTRWNARVPGELINQFAADPKTRITFLNNLTEIGRADLFPSAFLSQEQLAQSDMVFWLCSGFEMQAPPDAIETMDSFIADCHGDDKRFYVFKFYYPVDEEVEHMPCGWLAGVSGPWPVDQDDLTIPHSPETFSTFTPADSVSPKVHFKNYQEDILESAVRTPSRWDAE